MKPWRRLALTTFLLSFSLGCDQATKKIATDQLKLAPAQTYLGDLFRLQYAENRGVFLSAGASLPDDARSWLLVGGLGLLLAGLLAFVLFNGKLQSPTVGALALILGGGFSNWADRLLHGNVVVDFLNVGTGPLRTGIFNVADLFIELGAVLLLVASLRSRWRATGQSELLSGSDTQPHLR